MEQSASDLLIDLPDIVSIRPHMNVKKP